MRARAALAVVLTVGVTAGIGVPSRAQNFLALDEVRSIDLVNAARAAIGVGRLITRPELASMARAQAERMAARGEIFHNPNLAADITASGLRWARVGENVGVGPNVDVIQAAFMASPHHRANLLFGGYNAMGAGVVPGTGARSGEVFVAHVFAQLLPSAAVTPSATRQPLPAAPRGAAVAVVTRLLVRVVPSSNPNAVMGGVVNLSVLFGDRAAA